MFGLHPKLAPLLPLWDAGKLAAVHATGLPDRPTARTSRRWRRSRTPTRAPTLRERLAQPADRHRRRTTRRCRRSTSRGGVPPTSLYGDAADRLRRQTSTRCTIPGDDEWDPHGRRMRSLHRLWDADTTAHGQGDAAPTFRAVDGLRAGPGRPRRPRSNGAQSTPTTTSAGPCAEVARIVRGDVGVEVITVDQGDWDHHTGLGTARAGRHDPTTPASSRQSIAAFFKDLGTLGDKVTLVTISEFGRRVKENANQRPRPRLRQRDVPGRRRRQGRQYYGTWPDLRERVRRRPDGDHRLPVRALRGGRSAGSGRPPASVFPGFTAHARSGPCCRATPLVATAARRGTSAAG